MDFVRLHQLPRSAPVLPVSDTVKLFKSYKKRYYVDSGTSGDIAAIQFSPVDNEGGKRIAYAHGTKVQLCTLAAENADSLLSFVKHKEPTTCLDFRQDGGLIVVGDMAGHANIYSLAEEHGMLRRLRGHVGAIYAISFGMAKTKVVSTGQDLTVKIWDVPTGQISSSYDKSHQDAIKSVVAISENVFITGGYDGRICMFDSRESQGVVASVDVDLKRQVDRLCLCPSKTVLVSASGPSLDFWDLSKFSSSSSNYQKSPSLHSKCLTGLCVSTNGEHLLSASLDGSVKIREVLKPDNCLYSYNSDSAITCASWKDNTIVIGNENGELVIRERRKKNNLNSTQGRDGDGNEIYFVSNASIPQTANHSKIDFFLRKFEYKKLIDLLATMQYPPIQTISALDELSQRHGALPAALRNRSVAEIVSIMMMISKLLVFNPTYTPVLVRVFHTVLDVNKKVFSVNSSGLAASEENKSLMNTLNRCYQKVVHEVSCQSDLLFLQGMVETVLQVS